MQLSTPHRFHIAWLQASFKLAWTQTRLWGLQWFDCIKSVGPLPKHSRRWVRSFGLFWYWRKWVVIMKHGSSTVVILKSWTNLQSWSDSACLAAIIPACQALPCFQGQRLSLLLKHSQYWGSYWSWPLVLLTYLYLYYSLPSLVWTCAS